MTLLVPTLYVYLFACAAAPPTPNQSYFLLLNATEILWTCSPQSFWLVASAVRPIDAVCTGSKWCRTSSVGIASLRQRIPFSCSRLMQLFSACCRLSFKLKLNLIKMNIKENNVIEILNSALPLWKKKPNKKTLLTWEMLVVQQFLHCAILSWN